MLGIVTMRAFDVLGRSDAPFPRLANVGREAVAAFKATCNNPTRELVILPCYIS